MKDTIYIEFFGQVSVYLGLGVEIVTALVLGGAIGFDREQKRKTAGIKTNIMICLGSTLYTAISLLNDQGQSFDPNRVAAQVVSGVGFLGAGAIIQGRGNVIGMTTAATIWVVAAVGMAIGTGHPVIASIVTITMLVVLRTLGPLYKFFERERDYRNYHIQVLSKGKVSNSVKKLVESFGSEDSELEEEVIDVDLDQRILHVFIEMHPRQVESLVRELKGLIKVEKVRFHVGRKTGDFS